MTDSSRSQALGFLRVMLGIWIAWKAIGLLDRNFTDQLPSMLESFARANPIPPMRWLIQHVFVPHYEPLAVTIAVGHAVAGGALILGFLAQPMAVVGIIYSTCLFFVAGHLSAFHQGMPTILFLTFWTLFLGKSGLHYGVDQLLNRKPSSKTTVKPKSAKIKSKKQRQAIEALSKGKKKAKQR